MARGFLIIKGQSFMPYDRGGVSLKNSWHLLGMSYQACPQWQQFHCKTQLIICHGRKGKIINKNIINQSSHNHACQFRFSNVVTKNPWQSSTNPI